jgi:CheY-like chemotaxis protein
MNMERHRHQGRVLIVAADAGLRDGMVELLQREDYSVASAAHGQAALAALKDEVLPNVIFLDPLLPVMNGWVFRQEQQADPRLAAIPVVILCRAADQLPCAELRAAGYLNQPLDASELLAVAAHYSGPLPSETLEELDVTGACDIGAIFLEGAPPSS